MITVGWVVDEGAWIVKQDGEFIGDYETLEEAGQFALAVADNDGTQVALLQPE